MFPWSTGQLVNRSSVGKLQGRAHRTVNATGTKLVQPQAGSAVRHLHCIICNPLFGKEAELLELVWIDLRQIQHKKTQSGEVFLIWQIRLSQWAGNVAICQGKGKKRHYLLQISECKAMTNKSHFMQFKDKKKTSWGLVSQVVSRKGTEWSGREPVDRLMALLMRIGY